MSTNVYKPSVFVIMPFSQDYLELYDKLKNDFDSQFSFCNAGDLDNQQNILKDIVEGISNADVIIADLTGLNPNVFYELGLAHAMNKKVIILTQDLGELPFDIKSYRAIQYGLKFFEVPKLIDELNKLLNGAIDGTVKYGNPVSDYSPQQIYRDSNVAQSEFVSSIDESVQQTELDEEGEKGFLDFIADISESSNKMNSEITLIGTEMRELSASVNNSSLEINRVKASSGNVDPAFVRNICRKLASPVELFASKLNTHVNEVSSCWSVIENSYLSILDNKFTQNENNIEGLRESLWSLESLQSTICETDGQIDSLSIALKSSLGMERKLNKAITSLITGLDGYLNMTSTISSSIDRIKSKGVLVLKAVDGTKE